jgi:hypothetical protein
MRLNHQQETSDIDNRHAPQNIKGTGCRTYDKQRPKLECKVLGGKVELGARNQLE